MRTNLIKTKELPKVVEPSTTDGMLDMVIALYMATMDSVKDDVELSAVYTAYSKEVTE